MSILDIVQDELKQFSDIQSIFIDYVSVLPNQQKNCSLSSHTVRDGGIDRPYWVSWSEHLGAWVSPSGCDVQLCLSDEAWALDPYELTLGFTSVLAGICLNLLGQVAIHANAISIDQKAIALVGYSGAGKSTLSAFCASQGAGFLTDDVLVINEEGNVLPGNPRIKLYPEAGESLGLDTSQKTDYKIFYYPENLGAKLDQQLVPLGILYLLAESENNQIYSEPISPSQAVFNLLTHGYDVSHFIARNPKLLDAYIRLVEQVPVRRLFYPHDFDRLSDVYDFLQEESRNL